MGTGGHWQGSWDGGRQYKQEQLQFEEEDWEMLAEHMNPTGGFKKPAAEWVAQPGAVEHWIRDDGWPRRNSDRDTGMLSRTHAASRQQRLYTPPKDQQ